LVAHLHFLLTHNSTPKNSKELPSNRTNIDLYGQTNTTEKNNEGITAPWQKSGFCGYKKFSASNKHLWWLDSFVLLSPLLRQAAKRYASL